MLISRRLHSILLHVIKYIGPGMLFGSALLQIWDSENFEIILLEAYQQGCCRILEHRFSMLGRAHAVNNSMLICTQLRLRRPNLTLQSKQWRAFDFLLIYEH